MKKGQAAMEFLMTYGWAILVVIAAIAALAYFGVLDPAKLLPERCSFPAGMDCFDKASVVGETLPANNDGTVTVALRNNIAFPVVVSSIVSTLNDAVTPVCTVNGATIDYDDGNGYVAPSALEIRNNAVFRVRLNGCDIASGDKFDARVIINYQNSESGLSNAAVGDIRGRVQ